MKKLLTIAALAGVAYVSYGQGYVTWNNSSSTRVSVNTSTYGTSGGTVTTTPASPGSVFYYALFVAPSTDTTVPGPTGDPTLDGFVFTGIYATNTSAGRLAGEPTFSDGSIQINPPPGNQYPAASTANFAIVGWSANIGATWAAAEPFFNGAFGTTGEYAGGANTIATEVALANPPGPYTDVMGGSPSIGGFTLYQVPIPEPATFALCGLGAAALVIFRRRN